MHHHGGSLLQPSGTSGRRPKPSQAPQPGAATERLGSDQRDDCAHRRKRDSPCPLRTRRHRGLRFLAGERVLAIDAETGRASSALAAIRVCWGSTRALNQRASPASARPDPPPNVAREQLRLAKFLAAGDYAELAEIGHSRIPGHELLKAGWRLPQSPWRASPCSARALERRARAGLNIKH